MGEVGDRRAGRACEMCGSQSHRPARVPRRSLLGKGWARGETKAGLRSLCQCPEPLKDIPQSWRESKTWKQPQTPPPLGHEGP